MLNGEQRGRIDSREAGEAQAHSCVGNLIEQVLKRDTFHRFGSDLRAETGIAGLHGLGELTWLVIAGRVERRSHIVPEPALSPRRLPVTAAARIVCIQVCVPLQHGEFPPDTGKSLNNRIAHRAIYSWADTTTVSIAL